MPDAHGKIRKVTHARASARCPRHPLLQNNCELLANQFFFWLFTYAHRICETRRCQRTRRNFFSLSRLASLNKFIYSDAISRHRRAIKPVRSHIFFVSRAFYFSISSLLREIYKIPSKMPWSHGHYRAAQPIVYE